MSTSLSTEYFLSPEEYLAGERSSEQKHEYLAGVVYAMAGASMAHHRIADNIVGELNAQLRGRRCEAFSSDVKVRICAKDAEFYYYPDVTVDCSNPDDRSYFTEEPRVIFEVLSPDTERIDRGEKRLNYKTLATLDTYVLVDQFRVAVTVYRRMPQGWVMELLTDKGNLLLLPTIDCQLALTAIYARTRL
jgi:Uma2 family endonuclease